MIQTLVVVISTSTLTLGLLALYLRRTLPKILQSLLDDVGEQLKETFASPLVKRGMSILGQHSGDVRALKGAENALADQVINNAIPEAKIALGAMGIDLDQIVEDYGADTVLQLLAKYAPMIQGILGKSLNVGKFNSTTSALP